MQVHKISIILVQYNNSSDVVKCLESIKPSDYQNLDIVVVDNASTQDHVENIRKYSLNKFPTIISPENLGYSGGNNLGIKYALNHDADYVLILNPDTTIETDTISEMVKVAGGNNNVGIVGPVIDEGDRRKVYGGRIEWLRPELEHITNFSRPLKNADLFLTGACILVKREVFEKVGLFDERYFLYFEDADLCWRAQRAGYSLVLAKKALMHHEVSATTSKLGSAKLLRYHYRNSLLFNFKNAPFHVRIILPCWTFLIIIKQLIKLIVGKERQISGEIISGVADFYSGKFGKI